MNRDDGGALSLRFTKTSADHATVRRRPASPKPARSTSRAIADGECTNVRKGLDRRLLIMFSNHTPALTYQLEGFPLNPAPQREPEKCRKYFQIAGQRKSLQ